MYKLQVIFTVSDNVYDSKLKIAFSKHQNLRRKSLKIRAISSVTG